MSISKEGFAIILGLEENPLASLSELAEKINISWPTLKKRYYELQQKNILRKPVATYLPEKIHLLRTNVFSFVKDIKSLLVIEQACREHPYTVYRSRFFGEHFGVFIQFNIPPTSLPNLREFFEILKEKNVIMDYYVYPSTGIRFETYPNLKKYNPNSNQWDFSWKSWFSTLHETNKIEFSDFNNPIDLKILKPIYLDILRALTSDGSIKQAEIVKNFKISKSSAHRYYSFLVNNLVSSFRLNYDRDRFDLTSTYLLKLDQVSKSRVNQLYSHFSSNMPPFRTSFDILENNRVIIWANMSMNQASEFCFNFWKKYPSTQIFNLNTRDEGSETYWFYPPNFDFSNHQWKDSYQYMVEDPINRLMR